MCWCFDRTYDYAFQRVLKMLKKNISIIIILFLSLNAFPQKCFEYYKSACIPKTSKFVYTENHSSVSFQFSSGETREIPFTLVNGIDYRFTICADNIFSDIIEFAISTNDGKEMYNNSSQGYNLNLEFACRKTRDVIINIQAPQVEASELDSVNTEGCIGVLIEEMVSVKTGF